MSAPALLSEFRSKSSNTIEAGGFRKPFDVSEWVESPITVDGKHSDGALPRQEVEQILAISTDRHVEVGGAVRQCAENGARDRCERTVGGDRKPGDRRCAGVVDIYPLAIRTDRIPAVAVAKRAQALGHCRQRTIWVDRVGRDARHIPAAWLVFRDDQFPSRRKGSCKDPCSYALVGNYCGKSPIRLKWKDIDSIRSLLNYHKPVPIRAHGNRGTSRI